MSIVLWFDRDYDYISEFIDNWNRQIKRLKYTFLVIAVLMVVIGILCAALPVETFLTIQILAAIALVIQGIGDILSYTSSTYYFKDPVLMVVGILNIVLGILVFFAPVALTAATLTFLLAILLLFSGTEKIAFSSKMKYYRIMKTGMITFSGVVSIVLAVVFLLLPLLSMMVLNYILALYLIIGGITLLVEALSMKEIRR